MSVHYSIGVVAATITTELGIQRYDVYRSSESFLSTWADRPNFGGQVE